MVKAGRMELDEFHIGDHRARAIGHGNAVADDTSGLVV